MDFFGTVRGRIGVAATGPLLLYATGGLAYGDVKESSSVNTTPGCPGFCGSASTSNIRAGWTVGAGGEWQFSPALSGKIEYLYYDLGTINQNYVDFRGLFPGTSVSTSTKTTGNIVRVGLNWHLH
jgi:outer membrane immunogenic protein